MISISILCLVLFCGCSKEEMAEGITEIDIDFVWGIKDLKRSPEVQVKNIPEDVEKIEINFFCDLLHDPHKERGGGSLP